MIDIIQVLTQQPDFQLVRNYWKEHDFKQGEEFAILTNIIHQEWAEVDVKAHKAIKGLKSQSLRDHVSEAELIFTTLAAINRIMGEFTVSQLEQACPVSVGTRCAACCANSKVLALLNVWAAGLRHEGRRKGNYPLVRVIKGVMTTSTELLSLHSQLTRNLRSTTLHSRQLHHERPS